MLAQTIANRLLAPFTVAPQVTLAQYAASGFADNVLDRLDDYRTRNGATTRPADARRFQVFAMGDYNGAREDAGAGSVGLRSDTGGVTVGAEFLARPGLLVGLAFNHTEPDAGADKLFGGRSHLTSDQAALYGSFGNPNWFVDGLLSYGFNQYDLSRLGIVNQLRASPGGGAPSPPRRKPAISSTRPGRGWARSASCPSPTCG